MRIGYSLIDTVEEKQRLHTEGKCAGVVIGEDGMKPVECFKQFASYHSSVQIVVVNLKSLGIRLCQFSSLMSWIKDRDIRLAFLETESCTNEEYLDLLVRLSIQDQWIVQSQTTSGLKQAKKEGRIGGRPTVDKATILKIKRLYTQDKCTMREVSVKCGVSLGTVSKYVK